MINPKKSNNNIGNSINPISVKNSLLNYQINDKNYEIILTSNFIHINIITSNNSHNFEDDPKKNNKPYSLIEKKNEIFEIKCNSLNEIFSKYKLKITKYNNYYVSSNAPLFNTKIKKFIALIKKTYPKD